MMQIVEEPKQAYAYDSCVLKGIRTIIKMLFLNKTFPARSSHTSTNLSFNTSWGVCVID